MAPNTVQIWTAPPLPYLFITATVIEFEKLSLSNIQNLETVNTFTVDDKYSVLNRDNLTQPIQTQLSQN